jgi:tyrosyl-tRNA synthetase
MQVKKDLAARIVTDFHGADAASTAAADWARQFQKDEAPEQLQQVAVRFEDVAVKSANGHAVKLDKVLARAGLADSATEALRKIRNRAVRIDGEVKTDPILPVKLPAEFVARVGRLMKKIAIQ